MSKIQSFGTKTRLKVNELLAFGREIEAAIVERNADTLKITDVFAEYQTKLQVLDDGIVIVAKSAYTAEMNTAGAYRNNIHIGIIEHIRTGMRHFKADIKEGATRLQPLVSTYTGAQTRGFDDQTGFEYNFIQELESDKYKADITLLGLDEWVAELKRANDQCALLTSNRSKEKSEKAVKNSTTINRPIFEKTYDALVEYLNALALINGDTLYTELFSWWNARIDHYRVVISNNLGAGKGGQTGGGNKPPVITGGSGGGSEEERPGEL
ncbi:DUF6261 family protein [uncultured Parabacteroides sp.]|uniref:DUF6261 family protein n=1 Tax=uncultured Parabacteroides sp. TaxID=512312 RepID=UPI0025D2C085|nr:DUF6261 family protein [uncultured Parabacteroides sp.]